MIDEKLVNSFIDNYLSEYIDNIAATTIDIVSSYYTPEFFRLKGVKPHPRFGLSLVVDGHFLYDDQPATFFVQDSLKRIHKFMIEQKYEGIPIYEIIREGCEKYNKYEIFYPLIPALSKGYKQVFDTYYDVLVEKPSIDLEITSVNKQKGGLLSIFASEPSKINAKINLHQIIVDYLAALGKYADEKFYELEFIQLTPNTNSDKRPSYNEFMKSTIGDEFQFSLLDVKAKDVDNVANGYATNLDKRKRILKNIKLVVGINTDLSGTLK